MCSAISSEVPAAASCAERLADQPRTRRVELGRRLVEDHVARPHREERGDRDELGLAAGQPLRVAAAESLESEGAIASGPRDGLGHGRPRFIGPRAISSKTVAAIPDRWVFGFWKPTTTRSPARGS